MPELTHDGRRRGYRLYVPESVSTGPAPLVFVLHGSRGTGELIARITRFDATADRAGCIACYPDGYERHWNDGRNVVAHSAHELNVDDVGFVLKLIEIISDQHEIDRDRVYIAGASNGAMMTYRMLFEAPGIFAAVAGVMCPLHVPYAHEDKPDHPEPVLMIHGTADPIVPYEGGYIGEDEEWKGKLGEVLSVRDAVDYWVRVNDCNALPEEERIVPESKDNPMAVWRETYSGPAAEVVLYTVQGGGHTWPGGQQYAPESLIGKTCRAFSASDHIWEFFSRHCRA